jgi:VanZ family protein
VLLWLAVIAVESYFLSGNVTGGWLWYLIVRLHIPISAHQFAQVHHWLRKAGHVTGYGILCVLCFRAWWHTFGENVPRGLRIRCACLALGITLITAMLDEWHQSFDPARTSSVRDVGLDVTGGIVFLLIALFVLRFRRDTGMRELEPASA